MIRDTPGAPTSTVGPRPPAPALRVALYGGAFDPPHVGHLFTCQYLLACKPFDQVWLLPSWRHAFDKRSASYELRLALCQALAEAVGPAVHVSEVERQLDSDGKTLHVVRHLLAARPEVNFSLAVGADNLALAHRWYRWDEIERLVPIVVVGRAGFPPPPASVLLPDVSSTAVRALVAAGQPIGHLVPAGVARLIERHGLYR